MPGVYLNPLDFPDDWNSVVFAGTLRTPGKCKVSGWKRPVEYDHKAGKGTKGAKQTLKGLPPADGEIEFWAWTPDHFAAWTDILTLLHFDPSKGGNSTPTNAATATTTKTAAATTSSVPTGGIPGSTSSGLSAFTGNTPTASANTNNQPALSSAYAIDIFHPAIADLDVHYVLPPDDIGCWEEDGEASGMYKRTIKFHEYTGDPPNTSVAASPTGAAAANTAQNPSAQPAAGSKEGSAAASGTSAFAGAAADAQGSWGAP